MLLANRGFNLFDDFFRDPFFSRPFENASSQIMKTDIHEKDNVYMISMELPGFVKEDIRADLKDGYLTISAKRNDENEEKDSHGCCVHKERYTGTCTRSFFVGETLTQEDIKASFKEGILELSFPKEAPKAVEEQPKLISIE